MRATTHNTTRSTIFVAAVLAAPCVAAALAQAAQRRGHLRALAAISDHD